MTAIGYTWTRDDRTGWGTFARALERHCIERGIPVAHHVAGHFDGVLLHGFGEGLHVVNPAITGTREIAVGFLETPAAITPDAVAAHAARFPLTIAGSAWLGDVLRAKGVQNVEVVVQGVHPPVIVPRSTAHGTRPVVFSGGKLEYRKGQDRVVVAFRDLLRTHPDALLLTAWQNGYESSVASIEKSILTWGRPARVPETGLLDVTTWAEMNGIPRHAFRDLGWVAKEDWPQVWADVDVAWLPSRAEGGTNLVLMEALAHGVPCYATVDTGHGDLREWIQPWGTHRTLPFGQRRDVARGEAFAARYSWDACCAALLHHAGVAA